MIIYFKVGNYKSIKDTINLNFNATSISELADSNIVEDGKLSLLKSIVLYGHNASGKSKILDAFVFFKWFINNSATEKQSNDKINVEPFLLNENNENQPCFFEIVFTLGKAKYRYGFEADKNEIQKEWLLESKAKTEYPVFLRIKQEFEIDYKRFKNANELDKRTRKNALFLSVAAQWNVDKAMDINNWFESIFTVHGLADLPYREFTIELLENQSLLSLVTSFINKADLGINKLEVIDVPFELFDKTIKTSNASDEVKDIIKNNLKDRFSKAIFTYHNKFNSNGDKIGEEGFILDNHESEGTKKYFNIIGLIITAIKEGRVVVMDEFDARLHTLLSKAILKLFNSSKIKSTAQLLVASHDTALLDRDILRRDQIYFIEKDKYGASQATSLVEYKHRKESPIDKNYLGGKFGAIPFIDDLEKLFEDGKN